MSTPTPDGEAKAKRTLEHTLQETVTRMRAIKNDIAQLNRDHEDKLLQLIKNETAHARAALEAERERLKAVSGELVAETHRLLDEMRPPNEFALLTGWIPERAKRFYRKFVSPVLSGFAFFGKIGLTVIAIASFVYAVTPKLDVAIGETYYKDDPFATAFSIKNDGVLELRHVRVTCRVIDAQSGALQVGYESSTDAPVASITEQFEPSARITNGNYTKGSNFCRYGLAKDQAVQLAGPSYQSVSLEIIVEYRQVYWPFCNSQQFFYQTEHTSDGHLVWEQQAAVPDPFASAIATAERDRKTAPGAPPANPPPCSNY